MKRILNRNGLVKPKLHWDILDKRRRSLLPELRFLKDMGFYLAGGTALALQIRHRISMDFDFYNQKEFNMERILLEFQKTAKEVVLIQKAANILITKINGIEISLFTYPYSLLNRPIETEYINLASMEDIAAMKLVAIVQRGIQRDFIDLYFLIKRLGLAKIFQLTEEKYPPFNKYVGLQAITYFNDAERVSLERKITLLEATNWDGIKNFIIAQAKELKKMLER